MHIDRAVSILWERLLQALNALQPILTNETLLLLAVFCTIVLALHVPLLRDLVALPYAIARSCVKSLGFLGKHSREWSVVYDSKSKLPIDPAYVTIYDMVGRTVATAITDLDGRFGVLLNRGVYRIDVQKTNYAFPALSLKGKGHDGKYSHLYFGDTIEVLGSGQSLAVSIPMDPTGEDWNQKEKRRKGIFLRTERTRQYRSAMAMYVILGGLFLVARVSFVQERPLPLLVYLCGGVLVLSAFRYLFSAESHHHSVVIDRHSKLPLAFARVKVFSKKNGFEIIQKITSFEGQFVCLVPNGNYYVTIEKRKGDGSYESAYTSPAFHVRKGYIGRGFKV